MDHCFILPFILECRVKAFQDIIIKTAHSINQFKPLLKFLVLLKNAQQSITTIFTSGYKHIIILSLNFKY